MSEFKWWGNAPQEAPRSGAEFTFATGQRSGSGNGDVASGRPVSASRSRSATITSTPKPGAPQTQHQQHQPSGSPAVSRPPWAVEEDFAAAEAAAAATARAQAAKEAAARKAAKARAAATVAHQRPWQDVAPPPAPFAGLDDDATAATPELPPAAAGPSLGGRQPDSPSYGRRSGAAAGGTTTSANVVTDLARDARSQQPKSSATASRTSAAASQPPSSSSPSTFGPGGNAGTGEHRSSSAARRSAAAAALLPGGELGAAQRAQPGGQHHHQQRSSSVTRPPHQQRAGGGGGGTSSSRAAAAAAPATKRPGSGSGSGPGLLDAEASEVGPRPYARTRSGPSGSSVSYRTGEGQGGAAGGSQQGVAMRPLEATFKDHVPAGSSRPQSAGGMGEARAVEDEARQGLQWQQQQQEDDGWSGGTNHHHAAACGQQHGDGNGGGAGDGYSPAAAAYASASTGRPRPLTPPSSSAQGQSQGQGPGRLQQRPATPPSRRSVIPTDDDFHGWGLTMDDRAKTPPGGTSDAHARAASLDQENKALRKQVQQLKELLGVVQQGQGQGQAGGGDRSSFKQARQAQAVLPELTAVQRYKAQVAQLQRQVALLGEEMQAKGRVVAEAESALLEVAFRLEEVMGLPGPSQGTGKGASGGFGAGGPKPGGSGVPGAGGRAAESYQGEVDESVLVLASGSFLELRRFCRQMLARLKSERCQSARQLMKPGLAQRQEAAAAEAARGGGSWGGADGSGVPALRWQVPFIPAGGNRFLLAGPAASPSSTPAPSDPDLPPPQPLALTLPDLVSGSGASALLQLLQASASHPSSTAAPPSPSPSSSSPSLSTAACLELHSLERRMLDLAPRLASVAVLLRTTILPGMPWLSAQASERLQAEVAAAAEAAASASRPLSELAALVPSGPLVAAGAAGPASEPARRAAQAQAARDAWLWSQGAEGGAADGEGDGSEERGDGGEWGGVAAGEVPAVLGLDLEKLAAAVAREVVPVGAGGGKQQQQRTLGAQTLVNVLRRHVGSRAATAAARQSLLVSELRFCCRTTALQSQHVSRLVLTVVEAVEACGTAGAGGGGGAPSAVLPPAASALREVLQGLDRLDRAPSEAALRDLVALLRDVRGELDDAPDAMEAAGMGTATLEARLVQRLAALNEPFHRALEKLDQQRQRARQQARARAQAGGHAEGQQQPGAEEEEPGPSDPRQQRSGFRVAGGGRIALPWDAEADGGTGGGGGTDTGTAPRGSPPHHGAKGAGAAEAGLRSGGSTGGTHKKAAAGQPSRAKQPLPEWQD